MPRIAEMGNNFVVRTVGLSYVMVRRLVVLSRPVSPERPEGESATRRGCRIGWGLFIFDTYADY